MVDKNDAMTRKDPAARQSELPYGAGPGRSLLPVVALGILYAAWFLFLVWMALERAAYSSSPPGLP